MMQRLLSFMIMVTTTYLFRFLLQGLNKVKYISMMLAVLVLLVFAQKEFYLTFRVFILPLQMERHIYMQDCWPRFLKNDHQTEI